MIEDIRLMKSQDGYEKSTYYVLKPESKDCRSYVPAKMKTGEQDAEVMTKDEIDSLLLDERQGDRMGKRQTYTFVEIFTIS